MLYSSSTSYVNNSVTARVCVRATCSLLGTPILSVVTWVESNSVRFVADDDTTSAVSPTRRGAFENTYGMRNRR